MQIILRIDTIWSESSLSTWRKFVHVSLAIQNAPSEDSDVPAQMRGLIWIFRWAHMSDGTFTDSCYEPDQKIMH